MAKRNRTQGWNQQAQFEKYIFLNVLAVQDSAEYQMQRRGKRNALFLLNKS